MQSICLITGASSGLGRALALEYAGRGWKVIAVARSAERLAEVVNLGLQANATSQILPLSLDVTDNTAVDKAIQQIAMMVPQLDLVMLNAGTCEYVDLPDWPLDAFQRTFAINFHAVAMMVPKILPLLQLANEPKLAIVSSLAHYFPFTRAEAYGASKAALSYFTDSLRVDIAGSGIQVTLVEPGFIDTPLTQANDFSMPFMLTAEDAASRIANAIHKGALRYRFPKRLVFSLSLLNLLPYTLRQRVAAGMKQQ
jgi:NAD(P)-dependent dehydrogenase (short-subunit alcohol dehydrogenase family)